MAGAKDKLKKYFLEHVGEEITREKLREVSGNLQDWQRTLRSLRQETGLEIVSTQKGYILKSTTPQNEPKLRVGVDQKLKYAVLQKDNSTCQRCGANINNTKNVKLVVDHKIPVEMGGETTLDNLWTLCSLCNGGKQSFFKDENTEEMKKIMQMSSAFKRIKAYFEIVPDKIIDPVKLQTVANVRDWERTLRMVRQKENMQIEWVRPNKNNPVGGYINYVTKKEEESKGNNNGM